MNEKLSILSLIINASIVVQIIMIILIIMSIYSWTIIASRQRKINHANREIELFCHKLDNVRDITEMHNYSVDKHSTMATIFNKSYYELNNSGKHNIERAYRKINLLINNNIEKLEDSISNLAMIANSSPYIGLFGTVWGIMNSFLGLASVKQATIAVVAPGIAEALIATAFGLFAAIPASIYYNTITAKTANIAAKYSYFAEIFLIKIKSN